MQLRITKWGSSLGVRIPLDLAKQIGLEDGQTVELSIQKDSIVIQKEKSYTLQQLVSQITPINIHGEIGTGKLREHEEW